MNIKKKILSSMVAASMLAVASGSFAASPSGSLRADVYGDNLINSPMDESTVSTASPMVWFKQVNEAEAYTVDLVHAGTNGNISNACNNGLSPNLDRESATTSILMPSDISCGLENTATMPGDSTGTGPGAPPVTLCSWQAPFLANGRYAMAINPVDIGGNAVRIAPEERAAANCTPGTDDTTRYAANSTAGHSSVTDSNYQLFTVDAADPAATQAPNAADPLLPLAGSSYGTFGFIPLTFQDNSEWAGSATWYELFIWDKDNNRITSYSSNNAFPNWYKLGVDLQLTCNVTVANGNRSCSFPDFGSNFDPLGTFKAELATYGASDTFRWYVRGWNSFGYSDWSAAGTFVK